MEQVIDQYVWMVISGAIGIMVMAGVGLIIATMIMRPRTLRRQRLASLGVLESRKGKDAVTDKAESRRQRRIQDKVKQLQGKGSRRGFGDRIRVSMLQAGIDAPISTYFIGSLIGGVGGAFLAVTFNMGPTGALLGFLGGGFGVPRWFLGTLTKRRQKQFTQQFADAIDVVVRGIRSGLPVAECFNIVGREFPDPVSTEFRLMMEGQNLGMTIEDLMRRGLERIPTAEYKFFAIVIQIQKQTGGNLAETLANLSNVIRERKKMRDKVQALASEAKASAMIIGSLPFVVGSILALVNPDYLMVLFTERTGNILLGCGGAWMLIGSLAMAKMINFDM